MGTGMKFKETGLAGLCTIDIDLRQDDRGEFFRTFCKKEFAENGLKSEFVQFNHSVNYKKGTVRGMHFQQPPFAECKLIRCIRGSVFDVVVDIREFSPTFLKWFGIELSEKNRRMLYVPEGFAHGFQTLEDHSELLYHHTAFYEGSAESGIRYTDELIGIKWPAVASSISMKDLGYPLLSSNYSGINL
jgi:dTDP-4-dehydrorhamnose 3,5-epimerase